MRFGSVICVAWSELLSFWLLTIFILALPGPDWAFIIGSAASGRALVAAVGGLLAGYWLVILLVAIGVASVVAQLPVVLDLLTIIGAGYLWYLGISLIAKPATYADTPAKQARSARTLFAKGFGVSGLNPKGLLFFLVLLPQFTRVGQKFPLFVQILILGAVFTLNFVPFYLLLGRLSVRVLRGRPNLLRAVSRGSGIAMVLLGTGVAIQRFG